MTQSPEPVDVLQLLRSHPDDPPNVRWLRYAVIGMGLAMVVGFVAVIGRIVYLTSRPTIPAASITGSTLPTIAPAALASEVRLALPPGAKVRSQSLAGNRLAVHYESPAGEGIIILDLETGRPVSQVTIGSK